MADQTGKYLAWQIFHVDYRYSRRFDRARIGANQFVFCARPNSHSVNIRKLSELARVCRRETLASQATYLAMLAAVVPLPNLSFYLFSVLF